MLVAGRKEARRDRVERVDRIEYNIIIILGLTLCCSQYLSLLSVSLHRAQGFSSSINPNPEKSTLDILVVVAKCW